MKSINTIFAPIKYAVPGSPEAGQMRFILNGFPSDSESITKETKAEMIAKHPIASKISQRNFSQTAIIPIKESKSFINLLPLKVFLNDANFIYKVNRNFEYFSPRESISVLGDPFVFDDGTIFRVVGQGVQKPENYTYHTIINGITTQIPNFKTVQVLLAEKGQIYESIRVIEPSQYADLIRQSNTNILINGGFTPTDAEKVAAEIQLGNEPSIPIPPSVQNNIMTPPPGGGGGGGSGGSGGTGGSGGGTGGTGGTGGSGGGGGGGTLSSLVS